MCVDNRAVWDSIVSHKNFVQPMSKILPTPSSQHEIHTKGQMSIQNHSVLKKLGFEWEITTLEDKCMLEEEGIE